MQAHPVSFRFSIPTRLVFGQGCSASLAAEVAAFGVQRVLLVYDPGVAAAGLVDGPRQQLTAAGFAVCEFGDVMPNPPDYCVAEAAALARREQVQLLVAIGGGSTIDAAKAINILLTNPGCIADYEGFGKVGKPGLPLIALPTTAGTASEVTAVTVITNTAGKRKMVIGGAHVAAGLALADPELTKVMPPAVTAATGMDALTHAIEAYLSRAAMPPSDVMALEAVRLISQHLPLAYASGTDADARAGMLLGSVMAGFAFNSAVLGLVHSLAHPLSAHFGLPHGVANAICLPHVLAFNAPAVPERMRALAQAMGLDTVEQTDEQLSHGVVEAIHTLNRQLGMPGLAACGIGPESYGLLADDALQEASTPFNPRTASREDLMAMLAAAA